MNICAISGQLLDSAISPTDQGSLHFKVIAPFQSDHKKEKCTVVTCTLFGANEVQKSALMSKGAQGLQIAFTGRVSTTRYVLNDGRIRDSTDVIVTPESLIITEVS